MHFETSRDLEIDVSVDDPGWIAVLPSVEETIHETISTVIDFSAPFVNMIEISVVLTQDQEIQKLNRDYRGKDKPTNILSFGSLETPLNKISYEKLALPGTPFHLGDLILSLKTLQKESQEQNKILDHHFRHLIVHGMLHLLGHDHVREDDALVMENAEVEILKKFEILNPYLIQD